MVNKQLQYTNYPTSHEEKTMKFGQVIEYSKINTFFKNHGENEAGRLVPDTFLLFKKALYEVKASIMQLTLNIFR